MNHKMKGLGSLVASALLILGIGTSQGMPTSGELTKEKAIVKELMSPLVNDYKAGKKTAVEVGNGAMGFVAMADTQAAKFLLLRGAAHYYSLAKEYEKTADAIESIMKLVPDIPPGTLHEITTKVAANATAENAPRLVRLKKMSMARAFAAARLQEVEKELKAAPADLKLKRMHAELVAATGDWGTALAEFAELDGETGKMAAADSAAVGESFAIADFWWDYKALATEAKDAMREHAVGLYRTAIANGELDGLKRALAEKRISEVGIASVNYIAPGKTDSVSASGRLATGVNLRAGLVGHWRFDGNANDASGYRNNGIVRGVVPVEDRFGKANKAYRFSRGKFIEVPNSTTLQNITRAITITAWIKPYEWDSGFLVVLQKGNNRERQFTLASGRGLCWYGAGNMRESRAWSLGEWQFIALTYEHGKDARIYRNGELLSAGKADREFQANSQPLLIGCNPWGEMEYFIGDMDDVRIYNRALSEREIQELYKGEAPVSH
jgi:hypothetical protein